MAKRSFQGSTYGSGRAFTASPTYMSFGLGVLDDASTDDGQTRFRMRDVVTLSNLYIRVSANAKTATTTVALSESGTSKNPTVSIGASATGEFTDASNTYTTADGDLINYKATSTDSTNSQSWSAAAMTAEGTGTDTLSFLRYNIGNSSTDSTTTYQPLTGICGINQLTTEAQAESFIRVPGTFRKFHVYITSNARTTTTTYRVRVNRGNGNQSVSVTSSSTGWFEDTSNTESVNIGDEVNYSVTTSTGGGTISSRRMMTFTSTEEDFLLLSGDGVGLSIIHSSSTYPGLSGDMQASTTETDTDLVMEQNCSMSLLAVYLIVNSVAATSTATVRKNGASQSLSASITASTTGKFEDLSNTAEFNTGDDANIQITTGSSGSGNIELTTMTVHVQDAEPYQKELTAYLASDDADLANWYTGTEYTNVATSNDTRVSASAAGGGYAIHKYKDYTTDSSVDVTWEGQTNQANSISPTVLQVYNRVATPGSPTYNFDGSDAAATDPDNVWTNETNADDGSTSTYAFLPAQSNYGSVSSNYIKIEGTSMPATEGGITKVEARLYAGKGGGSAAYGSYTQLSEPTGGWTVAKVQALETKIYATAPFDDWMNAAIYTDGEGELLGTADRNIGSTNDTMDIYLVEFRVTIEPWETLDSDSTTGVNTDFTLTGTIPDTTNYLTAGNILTCRVYQLKG